MQDGVFEKQGAGVWIVSANRFFNMLWDARFPLPRA